MLHCKLHYDGRYILYPWSGNVHEVMDLAERFNIQQPIIEIVEMILEGGLD